MKVFVYFNLHKKLFSVKALEGPQKGKVIKHAENLCLQDVVFKVSQAGRQRVLKEKRKNVHAGVVGLLSGPSSEDRVLVTYNPYKYSTFVFKENEQPILKAKSVVLNSHDRSIWACI